MPQAQPHDLFIGLKGGYLPSTAEHYPTRKEATQALAEFKDRSLWDEPGVRGSIQGGYIEWGEYEHAYIEPCLGDCELEEEL